MSALALPSFVGSDYMTVLVDLSAGQAGLTNLIDRSSSLPNIIFARDTILTDAISSRCDVWNLPEIIEPRQVRPDEYVLAKVLNVLKSVATGDRILLEKTASGFDIKTLELLQVWVHEAITLKWDIFSESDLDPRIARRLLWVFDDVRPKLLLKARILK